MHLPLTQCVVVDEYKAASDVVEVADLMEKFASLKCIPSYEEEAIFWYKEDPLT